MKASDASARAVRHESNGLHRLSAIYDTGNLCDDHPRPCAIAASSSGCRPCTGDTENPGGRRRLYGPGIDCEFDRTRANGRDNDHQRVHPLTNPVLTLTRYRGRLRLLLSRAEDLSPAEPGDLRADLVALIDDLNRDLLDLYDQTESGSARDDNYAVVTAALEAMRNTLRRRNTLRPIRDLLRRAITQCDGNAR